jgi:hypothetical protein
VHVVLPITDPCTAHHDSLGSFAWVSVSEDVKDMAMQRLAEFHGIIEVYTGSEPAVMFELPLTSSAPLPSRPTAERSSDAPAPFTTKPTYRPSFARTAAVTNRSCRSSSASDARPRTSTACT